MNFSVQTPVDRFGFLTIRRTAHGVIGDARLATAAKGELLLAAASTSVSKMIELDEFWTIAA